MMFAKKVFICLSIAVFLNLSSVYAQAVRHEPIPNVGKIAKEFLVQRTVKYSKDNELFKTDIDLHPSKYVLLNEKTAKTSTQVYEKDNSAYYDPTKPSPKPLVKRNYSIPQQRYTNNIYPLDQKPYFGPQDYQVYTNVPDDRIKVGIKMGNLVEAVPTEQNLNTLKQQLILAHNDNQGPHYRDEEAKQRGIYVKDQRAYYDPSAPARSQKIQHLAHTIINMEKQLNSKFPEPQLQLIKEEKTVENYINVSKEATNNMIANSYHYDVDKNSLQKERINMSGVRIGSVDKYYDRTPDQTLVEADVKSNLKKKL